MHFYCEYKEMSAAYTVHLLCVFILQPVSFLTVKNIVLQKLIIASQLPSEPANRTAVEGQSAAPWQLLQQKKLCTTLLQQ